MTFSETINARISKRWDGAKFVEEDLTLSGSNGISVVVSASGFEISGADVTMAVKENDALVSSSVQTLDFGHALDVTDQGGGEVLVAVDETELTTVVFLTGDQTVSGNKTFVDNIVIGGDLTVNGTTTSINTDEVLIEDNELILNATHSGAPILDAALKVERGSSADAQLLWNETDDRWEIGVSGAMFVIATTDYVDGEISTLSGYVDAQDAATLSSANSYTDTEIATLSGYVDAQDAATLSSANSYTDTEIATYSGYAEGAFVNESGDTMTGDLTLDGADLLTAASGTNNIGSAANPFGNLYVDQAYGYNAPTDDFHLVNKAYVDASMTTAQVEVKEDDVNVTSGLTALDFGHALDVTDQGSGEVLIAVDESELTSVVFINDTQTVSGFKTFEGGLAVASGVEPADSSDTAGGVLGEIRFSDDYLYLNVDGTNWRRTAIAQF